MIYLNFMKCTLTYIIKVLDLNLFCQMQGCQYKIVLMNLSDFVVSRCSFPTVGLEWVIY